MDEPLKKRVDESWKEQAEREKRTAAAASSGERASAAPEPAAAAPEAGEELPQARFDLFVSGLAMEALIALGEMANPATRKQAVNLPQARYLIDLLGVFEEKTRGNLSVDEERLLKDTVYQLRMRYLTKAGK
jgi:hypothetical protein